MTAHVCAVMFKLLTTIRYLCVLMCIVEYDAKCAAEKNTDQNQRDMCSPVQNVENQEVQYVQWCVKLKDNEIFAILYVRSS